MCVKSVGEILVNKIRADFQCAVDSFLLPKKTLLLNPNQQKGLFTKLFDKFDRKPDNEEIFAFPILLEPWF